MPDQAVPEHLVLTGCADLDRPGVRPVDASTKGGVVRRDLDGVRPLDETALLDVEEAREVGARRECQRHGHGPGTEVLERDILDHAVADVAASDDEEGAVGEPGARPTARDEGRGMWPGVFHGQRLERFAVDAQLEVVQEAGVLDDQPMPSGRTDVTRWFRDAEAPSLDEGDRRHAGRGRGPAREGPTLCHGMPAHARSTPLSSLLVTVASR